MEVVLNVIFPLLVVVIGGACTLLLISTKTLRDSRDDQEKRITFLEGQHERDVVTIQGATAEVEALRKVVTGEVHLVAITDLLSHHHEQAVQMWDGWNTNFTSIDERLGHLENLMERMVTLLEHQEERS